MRTKRTIRPIRLNTTLPQDLMAQIETHLKKKHGGRIKTGDLQQFLIERIRAFFLEQEYSKCFRKGNESCKDFIIPSTLKNTPTDSTTLDSKLPNT